MCGCVAGCTCCCVVLPGISGTTRDGVKLEVFKVQHSSSTPAHIWRDGCVAQAVGRVFSNKCQMLHVLAPCLPINMSCASHIAKLPACQRQERHVMSVLFSTISCLSSRFHLHSTAGGRWWLVSPCLMTDGDDEMEQRHKRETVPCPTCLCLPVFIQAGNNGWWVVG